METMRKRYGLITAICMVVGIVVGSGIFFKAQTILDHTGGDTVLSIIAWVIGGVIMMICSAQFAVMATRYEKVNGVIDYAEATCGKGYAYYLGWFAINIYYPGMTSVLAWVSARYFGALVGWSMTSPEVLTLAGFLLVASYMINALSPKIAGKFQVSTTFIKFVPLILVGIVGIIVGLARPDHFLSYNFTHVVQEVSGGKGSALFKAVCATAFAYEGWIIATSINSEIKDAKRNLPIALVGGAFIVVLIYILYNIGVSGGAKNEDLINNGATQAINYIFGGVGGVILNVFVVISCLGTLNGLMVASTRGMYSLAARNEGPLPKVFGQIDKETNMAHNSSVWGVFICAVWLLYFYGANLAPTNWFGPFSFDSSELPIITIYAFYIPMLIMWMVKEKDLHPVKRFVLPAFAILGCAFMVIAAIYSHGIAPFQAAQADGKFSCPVLFYLIIFGVVMLIGFFFSDTFKKLIGKYKPVQKENENK